MKTITLKLDGELDIRLTRLAERLGISRSAVIIESVRRMDRQITREELAAQIRNASLKTRQESMRTCAIFDATTADGL